MKNIIILFGLGIVVVLLLVVLFNERSLKHQFTNSCILEINLPEEIILEVANTPFCNKYIQE